MSRIKLKSIVSEIIKEMVFLRLKRANLLGYKNHAEYVLAERMAEKADTVFSFSQRIIDLAFKKGQKELEELEKKYPEFPDLDEEESTLKVLSLKEKELDSLMFMGAQYLKKLKKGPMDKFFTRQQ